MNFLENFNPICFNPFIADHFPDIEIHYDDTNSISPLEHMYIFTAMLYFGCVLQTNEFFQKSCRLMESKLHSSIAKLFSTLKKYYDNNDKINKNILRRAINEATPVMSPVLMQFLPPGSPIRTPKVEKSPPTPNKAFIDEKLRELKHVKVRILNTKI